MLGIVFLMFMFIVVGRIKYLGYLMNLCHDAALFSLSILSSSSAYFDFDLPWRISELCSCCHTTEK